MPSTAPLSSPQRHSRRKAARPSELLEAALAEFVDKGYAATRVEAVAQRAGVSKGTLFLYYPSKEALFKALVHDKIASHFGEWNAELEAFAGDSDALVRHALQSWWLRIGQTPACALAKLVLSESARFPELASHYQAAVVGPSLALLARILARGVQRGELVVPDMAHACYSLLSPMVFLVMWRHALPSRPGQAPTLDPLRFLDTQADCLLAGLRSPAQLPPCTAPQRQSH